MLLAYPPSFDLVLLETKSLQESSRGYVSRPSRAAMLTETRSDDQRCRGVRPRRKKRLVLATSMLVPEVEAWQKAGRTI